MNSLRLHRAQAWVVDGYAELIALRPPASVFRTPTEEVVNAFDRVVIVRDVGDNPLDCNHPEMDSIPECWGVAALDRDNGSLIVLRPPAYLLPSTVAPLLRGLGRDALVDILQVGSELRPSWYASRSTLEAAVSASNPTLVRPYVLKALYDTRYLYTPPMT